MPKCRSASSLALRFSGGTRFNDAMVGVYERVSAACPAYRPTAFLSMTREEAD